MQWLNTNAHLSISLQSVVLLRSFPVTCTRDLGIHTEYSENMFSMAHYVLMGKDMRQLILHLTLMVHPWDQTRDMKPRPKLAGIWMVSNAREDGLNGKVTGKMCLASMSNWGESFLSRSRICKDKKAFSQLFIDNYHVAKR